MSADPQILDDRRTSTEFAAARPRLALLPLGATEQHGAHLPCGTDSVQVSYLADEIARAYPEPVWRLPTNPITVSHTHRGSPGSVWLTNGTLAAVVKDVVLSLRHEGITNTPAASRRWVCWYTISLGGTFVGNRRHGAPARTIQRTALNTSRRLCRRCPAASGKSVR